MPYICEYQGKYIGEHTCKQYHYGDMFVARDCCVSDCKHWKELTIKNATTVQHPAYRQFVSAWNELTDAEMEIVGDIVYDYSKGGFVDKRSLLCAN